MGGGELLKEADVDHGVISGVGRFLEADIGRSILVVDSGLSDVGDTVVGGIVDLTEIQVSLSTNVVKLQILEESDFHDGAIAHVGGGVHVDVGMAGLAVVNSRLSDVGNGMIT